METYQIEATIEKFSQGENPEQSIIFLKGAGKYLFEKSSENDEKKKYWSILEVKDHPEKSKLVDSEKFQIAIPKNELGMLHLLGYAFAEKKKLKFTLDEKYTITAVSHAST